MNILVSACLMGIHCKYDGGHNESALLTPFLEAHTLIPICPEQLGGLSTPRIPSERQMEGVVNKDGQDVTKAYQKGAEEALRIAVTCKCQFAILKDKSPSCGSETIYDGTFSKTLLTRDGVTTEYLRSYKIPVFHEHQEEAIIAAIEVIEKEECHACTN